MVRVPPSLTLAAVLPTSSDLSAAGELDPTEEQAARAVAAMNEAAPSATRCFDMGDASEIRERPAQRMLYTTDLGRGFTELPELVHGCDGIRPGGYRVRALSRRSSRARRRGTAPWRRAPRRGTPRPVRTTA